MISSLRGIIHRHQPENVTVEVSGVGYGVSVPISVWDALEEGEERELSILTYVREDRLELFGFLDDSGRMLFERFIAMNGIGPKNALELCGVPKSILMQAVGSQDAKLLTSVKGIGKKTAEKLLLDLKSLVENQPDIFQVESGKWKVESAQYDQDAVDALKNLGYDTKTILQALANLPEDLTSTEQRVTAAIRSL